MSEAVKQGGFFEQLERRAVALSPPVAWGFRRDWWWLLVMAVGIVLAVLPLNGMVRVPWVRWHPVVGLGLQLLGLGMFTWRQLKDVAPDFIDAKRKFAVDMDEHFLRREAVLAWLRSFASAERAMRLAYVDARLDALRSRYAVVFGAVDKLGVLPVAVAVLVQFLAIQSISPLVLWMGIGIAILYAMALWLSRFRLQLEGYARLLRAAELPGHG